MRLPCTGEAGDERRANLRQDLPIVAHEFSLEELRAEYGISDFKAGLTSAQVMPGSHRRLHTGVVQALDLLLKDAGPGRGVQEGPFGGLWHRAIASGCIHGALKGVHGALKGACAPLPLP